MTEPAISNLFKKRGIYVTNTRLAVFKIMLEHKGTINATQIQKLSSSRLDRISVYRALQAFLKKKLIITIPGEKGWPKYLVRDLNENGDVTKPDRMIVYFVCRQCNKVETLRTFKHIAEMLPLNHEVDNCQLIIEGKCSNCSDV
jgi:Fe2+ or Zn2+ uptake regulation protein